MQIEPWRESPPQPHALVVELHALGRQIVGADDGRVATGVAATEVTLLEDGDVGDPMVARQIVGRRAAVTSGADDDHVVARLQPLVASEHPGFRMLAREGEFYEA